MPIPQVNERIKEAPAVVLRAIFAGIGQLLMAADKVWAQVQEQVSSAPAQQQGPGSAQRQGPADETASVTPLRDRSGPTAHAPAATATAAAASAAVTAPAAGPATRPAARPATARTGTAPKAATRPKPATGSTAAAAKPTAAAKPAATPAVVPGPAAASQAPPIPGYDDLSIASLRARLRGLDADGVHSLLAYEKTHAKRDDVITMYERRLSKIENGAS